MTPTPAIEAAPARILIVDDLADNRELLEVMLEAEGYSIESVASGPEALARVAERAPDLVLLDVLMPGMNGYVVAERLKANAATQHIAIIMVSALHDRKAWMRGLSAGAEDFLTKPVDGAELRAHVKDLLRLKRS
jgi:PleD family two-component response regulator